MYHRCTVFYINEQFLRGDDDPWGVRYEAQILPHGSVVVGFMKWDAITRRVQELIDAPNTTPNQEQSWQQTLEDARQAIA